MKTKTFVQQLQKLQDHAPDGHVFVDQVDRVLMLVERVHVDKDGDIIITLETED